MPKHHRTKPCSKCGKPQVVYYGDMDFGDFAPMCDECWDHNEWVRTHEWDESRKGWALVPKDFHGDVSGFPIDAYDETECIHRTGIKRV